MKVLFKNKSPLDWCFNNSSASTNTGNQKQFDNTNVDGDSAHSLIKHNVNGDQCGRWR